MIPVLDGLLSAEQDEFRSRCVWKRRTAPFTQGRDRYFDIITAGFCRARTLTPVEFPRK